MILLLLLLTSTNTFLGLLKYIWLEKVLIIFKKNADCEPAECTPLYFFIKANSLLNWLAGQHKLVHVFSQLTDLLKAEAGIWVKT